MMPAGANDRMNPAPTLNGWISLYTRNSRTRRAISIVYWDPKSRMRILRSTALLHPVVRGFLGDDHVVHVALPQPRRGDLHEGRPLLELRDVPGAHVPHAGLQTADQLECDARQRAAVGDAPLDPLGDELALRLHVGLEVPVLAPLLHRLQRPHAAVHLVGATLVQDHLPRALLGAGEERPDHHGGRPGGDRLRDVAGIFDPAVGD